MNAQTIKISYQASVFTRAGWRSVEITAIAEKISEKRVKISHVTEIDGEIPLGWTSRTGSKRQSYNADAIAAREEGKVKNLASSKILN